MLLLHLMMALAAQKTPDAHFAVAARTACTLSKSGQVVRGINVQRLPAEIGEFGRLRVRDVQSGGWMIVHFDRVSEHTALAAAPCLGAQLRLLSTAMGRQSLGQWSSAVFATSAPTSAPVDKITRWHVPTNADGTLGEEGRRMVLLTIPHEQVHSDQRRAGAQPPRWFVEGHAEWVSRPIQRLIAPTLEAAERRAKAASVAGFKGEVALKDWGGLRIKREAVRRQVSADEQRRMDLDPAYYPPMDARSLKFGPDDLVNDDGDLTLTDARYQAAWRVFDRLERSHGTPAVRRWADSVTSAAGRVQTDEISALARREFGLELLPLLLSAGARS